jgi:hypothetical protein
MTIHPQNHRASSDAFLEDAAPLSAMTINVLPATTNTAPLRPCAQY